MYKIKRYFEGVIKQAKKVRWPSRKEMIGYVSIVLVFVIISALALFVDDFIIGRILNALEKALKPAETTAPAEQVVNVLLNIGRMFK